MLAINWYIGALIADAHMPKKNLHRAKTIRLSVMPAVRVVALKPRTPAQSMAFLFHFFEAFPIKIFEQE